MLNKNIAVVGAGYWGKNLVRTFSQLGVLSHVCDANQAALKKIAEQYPQAICTNSYQDVLNNPQIKSVVIATPAVTHFHMAKEAILHGKHVFVEKPLSLTVQEGKELVQLAKEHGRTLMVGHILQYHNAILKLKDLIDRGDLGKIQYIYSNRLNIGKIRTEENILWSFAPHDISVILMFLNETPESIHTTGGNYLQPNHFDVTMTNISFASGVRAHFFVSWLHPFKEQKLVVVGDKKMAVFDDVSQEKLFIYPHKVEWVDRAPVVSKAEMEILPFEVEEPLRKECEHFLECVEKGSKPRTDGGEGLRVLEILELAQQSLNTGKTVYLNAKPHSSEKSFFVHGTACVDEDVQIGDKTQVWHYSHILKNSNIGRNCKIGQNVMVGPDVSVGNNCKIQNNVSVYKGVTLEDGVFCGPSMVFTNVFNPRSEIARMDEMRKTLVKKGATIGANATIICGITIGRYAMVGAGAVVTKDVPDYALVYGNPARLNGWVCECGVKLDIDKKKIECNECHKQYQLKNNCLFPSQTKEKVLS